MKMFVIITLLIFHPLVFACSGADKTIEYKYDNAEKIFRGRVVSFKKVERQHPQFRITHEVTILTSEVFKGNVGLIEKVYASYSSSSCGFGLDDKEKIFFVDSTSYSGMLLGTFQLTLKITQEGGIRGVRGEEGLLNLRKLSKEKENNK
ncbi:MAG: hypothetical protein HRT54_03585 [Colwellia sp.]|nr:hypothetical protein [Colwellia sp.]